MNAEKQILRIGKSYIVRKENFSRLCADITAGKHRTTLWFAVDVSQEDYLCLGRADAFVVALLPTAMRGHYDIVCEDSISEKLLYQLKNYLIPTLASAGTLYHQSNINADYTKKRYLSRGAVGTGFSAGVDSMYTIMKHETDSEYPLDYIAVFNTGNIEKGFGKEVFWRSCKSAARFAEEQKLKIVCVDTNFVEVLPEHYYQVYTFRNLACALALQGLFKIYLLSSGPDAADCRIDLQYCDRYDLLTVNCVSTESLRFYLSGVETTRGKKLETLTEWEPSWYWLHPCTRGIAEEQNCGHCKKCICDATTLYALGKLERYRAVFDVNEYLQQLPSRIGFVLSLSGSRSCMETKRILKERNIPIPRAAYIYEQQFRKAIQIQNQSILKY